MIHSARISRHVARVALVWIACGCGSRTGLDLSTSGVDASAAETEPASHAACVPAPRPTVLVSLTNPATYGSPSFALTGDASRIYTFVFGEGQSSMYRVLSIDPCTGSHVAFGSSTYQSPLATDGHGVYFTSYGGPDEATFDVQWFDPLGQSHKLVAALGADYITELTVAGGRGYAVDHASSLVTLALDGNGPMTLVPPLANNLIRVWWDGTALDDEYAYFYGNDGVDKIPKGGGPTTNLFKDGGDAACGGSEPPGDPLVLVDDTNVYMSGANGLRRVAKDGSSTATYPGTESSRCGPIAIDDTYVYFQVTQGLSRVPKGGGPIEVLAKESDAGGIVVTTTSIYWLDFANAVMKLDKP
jgi:hypothetical protein